MILIFGRVEEGVGAICVPSLEGCIEFFDVSRGLYLSLGELKEAKSETQTRELSLASFLVRSLITCEHSGWP